MLSPRTWNRGRVACRKVSLISFFSGIHLSQASTNESALVEGRKFYRKVKGKCWISRGRGVKGQPPQRISRQSSIRRAVMVCCAVEKGAGSLWVRHTVLWPFLCCLQPKLEPYKKRSGKEKNHAVGFIPVFQRAFSGCPYLLSCISRWKRDFPHFNLEVTAFNGLSLAFTFPKVEKTLSPISQSMHGSNVVEVHRRAAVVLPLMGKKIKILFTA